METFFNYLLEFFFIVAGVQFSYAGYRALKDKTNQKNMGTAIFGYSRHTFILENGYPLYYQVYWL